MNWIPVIGLALGALLAQRVKVVWLLPATLVVALVVFGVATTQTISASSSVLIMVVTTVAMQAGYFVGMLVRRGISGASRVPSLSQTTSVRDPVR